MADAPPSQPREQEVLSRCAMPACPFAGVTSLPQCKRTLQASILLDMWYCGLLRLPFTKVP
eukprot:5538311-Pyramimonas_sp.AAC.1